MVKKTRKDRVTETAPPQATPEKDERSEKESDLAARLEEKEKEAAENYDKYLRAMADLENIRKRAVREKADSIKYGNETLIKDMLPMIDSLDRALKHAENSGDFESFKQGLKLVQDQMRHCLARHGVEQIDCLNKVFDPNVHEALFQIESDVHEDSRVVDELEKGYLLNGRLLRPAKVSVCKRTKEKNCEETESGRLENKEE